jgi:hypothetical protein
MPSGLEIMVEGDPGWIDGSFHTAVTCRKEDQAWIEDPVVIAANRGFQQAYLRDQNFPNRIILISALLIN